MAPELLTPPNFTDTHSKVANNPDFYRTLRTVLELLTEHWYPHGFPELTKRYRSRKGRLAQNVLAICDFDMNFTYVYAGWEGSAADARVLDHAVSQDPTFPFPPIGE
ncbi:UNVERIFIED_CONTAM: hypothetical protein Sradi_5269900 [Sesamum radiatum]|uniref:Transposase n=1 Tax=Sesamum radiatum TaxID=300843 RepID=A0AAW2LLQ1_SESRA